MSLFSSQRALPAVIGMAALALTAMPAPQVQAQTEGGGELCSGYQAPQFPDLTPIAAVEGTRTVTSPFGEVTLPTAPGKAFGMYTTDVDILVWLGYPLATTQPIRGDNGYTSLPCFFPNAQLSGITYFANYPEFNYEQILLAEPDFILNGLGYDAAVNERLPQIAPTYSVDAFDGRSWRDHFKETAEALVRPERYQLWVDTYEARLAEVKEEIKANADAVVAPFGYWNGVFASGCYVGVECSVFRDLGLTIFEGSMANDGSGVELSPEEVGQFAPIDFAFTGIGVGDDGVKAHEELMAEAAKNPVWTELGFVKDGHVVTYDLEIAFGSPSGQLAFLEVVAKALSE
jgi:iron complex transport system substrate-binding protein